MRYGFGRVYQRGRRWWVGWYVEGVEHREPGGRTRREAEKKLKRRLREDDPLPHQDTVTIDTIVEDHLVARRGLRSIAQLRGHSKPLLAILGHRRALAVTVADIERYKLRREGDGRAPATIALELQILRASYRHAIVSRKLPASRIPHITIETPNNARQGFLSYDQFQRILANVKDPDLADFLAWSFWSAMRPGETRKLTWHCVDPDAGTITVPPQTAKIKRGRTIALAGPLLEIIQRRQERRIVGSELIFHRRYRGRMGHPVNAYRDAWASACRAAGLEAGRAGVVPYDLRRSGLRAWVRAGVAESTVMKVSGHRTRATFDRYNIIDVEDTRQGIGLVEGFLKPKAHRTRTTAVSGERNVLSQKGELAEADGLRIR